MSSNRVDSAVLDHISSNIQDILPCTDTTNYGSIVARRGSGGRGRDISRGVQYTALELL